MDKLKKDYVLKWIDKEMISYGFCKEQVISSYAPTLEKAITVIEYLDVDMLITFTIKFGEYINLFIDAESSDGTPLGDSHKKITSFLVFESVIRNFLQKKLGLEKTEDFQLTEKRLKNGSESEMLYAICDDLQLNTIVDNVEFADKNSLLVESKGNTYKVTVERT